MPPAGAGPRPRQEQGHLENKTVKLSNLCLPQEAGAPGGQAGGQRVAPTGGGSHGDRGVRGPALLHPWMLTAHPPRLGQGLALTT